jgi:hypothetical protein
VIKDFEDVCTVTIDDDEFTVTIKPKEPIDHLEEEFANYVLGIMKNEDIV